MQIRNILLDIFIFLIMLTNMSYKVDKKEHVYQASNTLSKTTTNYKIRMTMLTFFIFSLWQMQ